jgi:hypothetical protein
LKTICDGEVSCTRLYRSGSFNIKIYDAKLKTYLADLATVFGL